jgi:hypothetical protein
MTSLIPLEKMTPGKIPASSSELCPKLRRVSRSPPLAGGVKGRGRSLNDEAAKSRRAFLLPLPKGEGILGQTPKRKAVFDANPRFLAAAS